VIFSFLDFRRLLELSAHRLKLILFLIAFLSLKAAAQAQPTTVAAERISARATMTTFLEAFYQAGNTGNNDPLAHAVGCLDLSEVPERFRSASGLELAVQLKEVLDRIAYIEVSRIPDNPNAPMWTFYRAPYGEVSIGKAENGEWLFTTETVRSIPELFSHLRDRPVVGGMAGTPRIVTPGAWLQSRMPQSLRRKGFLLEHWQWLGLFIILLLGLAVWRIATWVLAALIGRLARRKIDEDEINLLKRSVRPLGLLLMSVTWIGWARLLSLPLEALQVIDNAFRFVAGAAAVWFAFRVVDFLAVVMSKRATGLESRIDSLLISFVRTIMRIIVVLIGIVIIAENFDVKITGLVAGLGVGGIAIALAAQDTLGNFFGSLAVMFERPFRSGDFIKVGDIEGVVEDVGLRSTRLRTPLDSIVTVPNSTLAKSSVDNIGARRYRRWRTILSVTYDTKPETIESFCEGVRKLIPEREFLRQDAVQVYLHDFSPQSLQVLVQVFFEAPDIDTELTARHKLALDILNLAEKLGVKFIHPQEAGQPASKPTTDTDFAPAPK
jgi:MscS family membrane protein